MAYVGIHTQITRNNTKSILLLIGFPAVIIGAIWLAIFLMNEGVWDHWATQEFLAIAPIVMGAVALWFLIAFLWHSKMIHFATGAKPLERKENMRVYNLVENLCMSQGMKMPKVYVIESNALNAFASGLNEKTFAITLTRGIIDHLDDAELEGVIAHELAHIINRDVRLLIISIIFVGILSFVVQVAFRSLLWGGGRDRKKVDGRVMLVILIVSALAYLVTILFRFSLSRRREFMADAGAAQMTKRPDALASALRKISGNHSIDSVKSSDVKSMFIENGSKKKGIAASLSGLFATHPPIDERIRVLEQF